MAEFDLHRFQRWMLGAITHRHGLDEGLEAHVRWLPAGRHGVDDMVLPSSTLSARERLGIYANQYYWRLTGILKEDFPATHAVLGESADDYWRNYLAAHPPAHQRLTPMGAQVADWLRRSGHAHAGFLSDLSRLEYAMEWTFEAPRGPTLDADALASIQPEDWARARLEPITAFVLLETEYPVQPFLNAFEGKEVPPIPSPEKSWCRIWRQNFGCWHAPLDEVAYTILKSLGDGAPLLDAFETASHLDSFDPATLQQDIGRWFQEWSADRLFARIHLP